MDERYVDGAGVRLHCLEHAGDPAGAQTPLLIIPGTFGTAEDYVDEMSALSPRRSVAVSLRGRGRSDAPASGYRFEDHVADIARTVAQTGLERFALMGYSMGAAYALGYAIESPQQVVGLVVGDYPARYRALSPKWVGRALESLPGRATLEVASALQRDSSEVNLWDRIGALRCPVTVLRGGQAGSVVTPEIAAMYRERLADVEIHTLERSAHELWKPDFAAYVGVIRGFLERVDERVSPPAGARRAPS